MSCRHDYVWTAGYRISCVGDPYETKRGVTYNAECKKCGKKVWAHGRTPWRRVLINA